MFFQGPYLRVLTPKTVNGVVPALQDGRQEFIETFAPLTARKALEKKNARLQKNGFSHLVSKIEEVGSAESVALTKEVAAEKAAKTKNKK